MHERSPSRSFDWISLFILETLFLVSGMSFLAADWADHLSVILAVGALAVGAGAALGYSRFSGRLAALLAAVYGVFVLGAQLGGTLDRALSWPERAGDLLGRLGAAALTLARGDVGLDPLIFVAFIAALFWIFGVIAGWVVFRHAGLWAAVLPIGTTMLVSAYFYAGKANLGRGLATFVLVALLLAARLELRRRERVWRSRWALVSSDVAYQVGRTGAIAALILVILAWGGPAFAQSKTAADLWTKAGRPWTGLKQRIGKALDTLRRQSTPVFDAYSETLSLGAGSTLPNTVVMQVRLAQPPSDTTRLYWQTRRYEVYDSGKWNAGPVQELELTPEQNELPLVIYAQRQPIEAWFQPSLPAIKVLPVPGQTVWINRTVTADIRKTGQGVVDVVKLSAEDVVRAGETYHLWGWVTDPSAESLRAAGTEYPNWVVPGTLQLPLSVTDRTRALARSITEGLDNPYDKAEAITDWLRSNIEYRRVTVAPPPGQDPIDWFLFDYRIGYCNFYASAEVVLLRSLGIPSRLAVGYASGNETSSSVYEVHADDAHAWPEVFFPTIGWVQFEPTTSQPALVRPERSEATQPEVSSLREFDPLAARPNLDQPEQTPVEEPEGKLGLLWLGLAIVIVGGGVVWLRYNPRLWASASYVLVRGLKRVGVKPPAALERAQSRAYTDVGQIYASWTQWFDRLGPRLTPDQTPYERAQIFAQSYPSDGQMGWSIAKAYAAERFGRLQVELKPIRDAWRDLHLRMIRRWIRARLGQPEGWSRSDSQGAGGPSDSLRPGAGDNRNPSSRSRPGV